MELDREAKASMSIYDATSLVSRLNRNETDSVDRHIVFNLIWPTALGEPSERRALRRDRQAAGRGVGFRRAGACR